MKILKGLLSLVLGTRILGEVPKPGERYLLDRLDEENPFDKDERPCVTILDVKDGWVKYQVGNGYLSPDSASVRTFLTIYTKRTDA